MFCNQNIFFGFKWKNFVIKKWLNFLAALSSSRSLAVGPSIGRSVRHVSEKVIDRVSKGN